MPLPHEDPLLSLTAQIVSAHVEHHEVSVPALSGLIRVVYSTLAGIGGEGGEARQPAGSDSGTVTAFRGRPAPASPAKGRSQVQTVFDDHVVCLECGMQMKMLKRHLQTVHGETPAQYRMKWNLAADHPMVAREYAALRSNLAKESGLGKRPVSRGR